ncbi:pentapeptide repeat-containing protein [Kamptonema sp. UHCC 0994]|uniref:pentapeptide repeat-containing protein n=1 Tax=Kamptonema sp. UHCC 0994 TaxID=3031329 RepID=UPI0023B92389|nr:pentapeptide repeat-containing protein [Kamptonema sp. UHCC 0994]MDF0554938.1 pentapeptide repeat-containing protein [Kamptonema sp. UHCC 0994]
MLSSTFRNFRNQNLQGQSFKGQDLTNTDFSYANIQGADFTGANLTGANFSHAKTVLSHRWLIGMVIVIAIIAAMAGIGAAIAVPNSVSHFGSVPGFNTAPPNPEERIDLIPALLVFLLILSANASIVIISFRQGIQKALGSVLIALVIAIPLIGFLGGISTDNKLTSPLRQFRLGRFIDVLINKNGEQGTTTVVILISTAIATMTACVALPLAITLAEVVGGYILRTLVFFEAMAIATISSYFITINDAAIGDRWIRKQSASPLLLSDYIIIVTATTIAGILVLINAHIGKKTLAEDEKYEILRQIAIFILCFGGPIFRGFTIYSGARENAQPPLLLPPDYIIIATAIILAATLVFINTHIGKKTLAEDPKYDVLRQIAIFILCLGGPSFRGADLSNTNFSYATLKSADFSFAKIDRTLWYNSHQLDWARVGETILTNHAVRDLLVTRNGYRKSYQEANLRGANLIDANLNYANLKNADLTNATLEAANLEWANLTQVQAINADFTNAQMTGSCGLGTWNIDSTTQLEWVDCRWVYLLEEPKPGTDDRERRPSSGEFVPGDFSKLFQEVVDTVDLIFRNGIDWKAFAQSFKKVQVENEDTELTIQSIENKGNGVIVVKVSVPSEANKGKIHSQFLQFYDEMIALATNQNQQLETYGQQMQWMTSVINQIVSKSTSEKLVILKVINGSFEQGFTIIAQIWSDRHRLPREFKGKLPASLKIAKCYHNWQAMYNAQSEFRIKPKKGQVTNFSKKDLKIFAEELEKSFNSWLDSELFRPIEKKLRQHLNSTDEIRLILQTEDALLRHIPWHLWTFLDDYRKAELGLSLPESDRVVRAIDTRNEMRILAILGNSEGINVIEDRRILENLPNAETVFLVEPTRQQFDELLWDEQGWDILCFSGHSHSEADGKNGFIYLNNKDKLSLEELENALKAAIERGLQLAIFNSCDGLGLATNLANLYIPQIIVMREPVPDLVAQEFLKSFLKAFSSGKSLYISVREAREKLQSLEEKFSYASWLPVICQNQAEIPLTWRRIAKNSTFTNQTNHEENYYQMVEKTK